MSSNPFANVERIIHTELLGKARALPYPPEDYHATISELFAEDALNVFHKVNALRVENTTRAETVWMIQSYQEKIDNLMGTMGMILDELDLTLDMEPLSGSWHEFMMETIYFLEEMMDGLLRRHPDLFDLELPMSDMMEALFVKKNSKKICEELILLPEDSARCKAYKMLLLPMEEPIDSFCYRHIFYFDQLINETSAILHQQAEDEEQAIQILDLLWELNFNHPAHVAFRWRSYAACVGESKGKERVKLCLELWRELRLNKPLSGAHLYFRDPSLSVESENWLNTELNCTRALMAAEAIIAVNPFAEFKIKTKLSLKQLAGILRMFSEKGILQNEDRRELIRFFATYFVPVSGKRFSLAALTRSFDQHKGDTILQQLKGLLE